MRLYLEAQVEAAAHAKWGGAERLEAERQRQIRTRALSRKRRAAAQEREERAAAAKLQKVEEGVRAAREAAEVHVHTFVDYVVPGGGARCAEMRVRRGGDRRRNLMRVKTSLDAVGASRYGHTIGFAAFRAPPPLPAARGEPPSGL